MSMASEEDGDSQFITNIEHLLEDYEPPASEIISRSIISASFSGEDRFDWMPDTGLRVSIPDEHAFVPFERAPAAELRDRLFPFPHVRGNKHKSAPQPEALPEQSLAWWFAQMVHYGLPITINKQSAQKSIRAAILADRLVVPARLGELETRLKRQYVVTPRTRLGTTNNLLNHQAAAVTTNLTAQSDRRAGLPREKQSNSQVNVSTRRDGQNHSELSARQTITDDTSSVTSSDSEPTSSSDSETESTLRPGHPSAHNGHQIMRPVTNSTPHKKEQAAKNRQAHSTSMSQAGSKMFDGNQVQNGDKEFKNYHSKQTGKLKEMTEPKHMTYSANNRLQENGVVELDDSDSEEARSLIFFTPVQFMKKSGSSSYADQDQESVIFTGSRKKKKGMAARNESTSPSDRLKKQRTTTKNVKEVGKHQPGYGETTIEKGASVRNDRSPAPSTSTIKSKVSKKAERGKTPAPNRARLSSSAPRRNEQVIEISSGLEDSSDENGQNGIRARNRLYQNKNLESRPGCVKTASDSQHGQDSKHALITPKSKPKLVPSTTNPPTLTSGKEKVPSKHKSRSSNKKKKTKRKQKSRAIDSRNGSPDISTVQAEAADKPGSAKQVGMANNIAKQISERSEREPDSRPRFLINQDLGRYGRNVQDYTGCGTMEATGALHTDDEGAIPIVEQRESRTQIFDSVQPKLPESLAKSPHLPPLPSSPSSDGSASGSDLPCVMELFSPQDTPENCKSKERRAFEKTKKQAEIDKSFDPDSVPALREQLANAPSWMKQTVRHDSLELPHGQPLAPAVKKPKTTTKNAPTNKPRSKSVTTPRKRQRPSLIDIESAGSPSKKSRTAASRSGSVSALTIRPINHGFNTAVSTSGSKKQQDVRHPSN